MKILKDYIYLLSKDKQKKVNKRNIKPSSLEKSLIAHIKNTTLGTVEVIQNG